MVHWGNDLIVTRVKLASSSEITAGFNTELQCPSEQGESVSFPDQSLFSWFEEETLIHFKEDYFICFLSNAYVCGSLHACSRRGAVHMHGVVRTRLLLGSLPPGDGAHPLHARSGALVAMRARSHARAEGTCCGAAAWHAGGDFLCLGKGFAFGPTLLVCFRKFKLKYPGKDECTEHGILSWSSALNPTFLFSVLPFSFDCKGHIFPCMPTLQKIHNSPFCCKEKLCREIL